MFNFTFMFIKLFCHKSCSVFWCIITLILSAPFRVQSLNHWMNMVLQNGSIIQAQ